MQHTVAIWGALLVVAVAACSKDDPQSVEKPDPAGDTREGNNPADPEPPEAKAPKPEPDQPEPDQPEPATGACDTLDRSECLGALHCTMHFIDQGKYECRDSKGPCEVDLAQRDRPTCESREGCKWTPGECYCDAPGYGRTQVEDKQKNTGMACACGGGRPPRCMAASEEK